MSIAKKMYDSTPTMERDEESGKMKVKKAEKKVEEADAQIKEDQGIPAYLRHSIERREVHNRHETEHMVGDHGKESKEELHKRHQEEIKMLHKKHEKELAKASK